jgi:thymidylate synthase ThyX
MIEQEVIDKCKEAYNSLLQLGVSKEQARTILPLNLNTTMIWTGSLYSFIRICKQRLKPDAQEETRVVVQEMLNQLKECNKFQQSLKVYKS